MFDLMFAESSAADLLYVVCGKGLKDNERKRQRTWLADNVSRWSLSCLLKSLRHLVQSKLYEFFVSSISTVRSNLATSLSL